MNKICFDLDSSDLQPSQGPIRKFFNYAKVFGFLVCAIAFWLLFGWLADYSFPFGQGIELMLACFKGTISSKVNNFQHQLQKTDVIRQSNNRKQVQKLNYLESQAWLYQGILNRLEVDSFDARRRVSKTLEAIEYKRNEFADELEKKDQRNTGFLHVYKAMLVLQ